MGSNISSARAQRVPVGLCVCICLSGRNKLPRLLATAKYVVFDAWISLKMYRSKVIARNIPASLCGDRADRDGAYLWI